MNEALYIYLYIVAGNVIESLVGITIASLAITVMVSLIYKNDEKVSFLSVLLKFKVKWCLYLLIFAITVSALYPTKDDLKYILGGAVVINIAKNEEVKKLPENLLKAANVFLQGIAKEGENE